MKKLLLLVLLLLTACAPAAAGSGALPTRENPWLGQVVPGPNPMPFGSSLAVFGYHSAPTFTPDGSQVYFAADYSFEQVYGSRFVDGEWTTPETVSFSPSMTSYRDPFVSPDGKRLYFISQDALPGGTPNRKENIWVMEKAGQGWGEPQPLPESINQYALHWTISVTSNYDLYFSARENENTNLYYAAYQDGSYAEPVALPAPVNSDWLELTPNIAPDGSYLLFSRLENTSDTPKLYITYAQAAGWSEPQVVGNVYYCISPIVTPDRKYVIYLSSPSSLEWRDTSFVEELRPE